MGGLHFSRGTKKKVCAWACAKMIQARQGGDIKDKTERSLQR